MPINHLVNVDDDDTSEEMADCDVPQNLVKNLDGERNDSRDAGENYVLELNTSCKE